MEETLCDRLLGKVDLRCDPVNGISYVLILH